MNHRKSGSHVPLPTKQQVLEFIQDSPNRVGKRELARAFQLPADQRPFLREIIKELEEEGLIQRGHKRRFARPGALPEVCVLEIHATDREGELLARPLSFAGEDGEEPEIPPRIYVAPVRRGQNAVGVGDRVLARLSPQRDNIYEARVIKRLASAPARVLGIVDAGTNGAFLRPTNKRDKQDYVIAKGDLGSAEPGDLVEAELLPGRRFGLRPVRVVEVLGSMTSPRAISLIAIHTHGIPFEFSVEALEQAAACGPAPMGQRQDLRSLPLVTIDGEDARDFDDAVWAEPDDSGDGWQVVVAIADVAHYVRPNDALDGGAFERGNSVYFPDRVVPMLPEALSNGWCSLRPNEDRPCLAVRMWIDSQGNKHRHEFMRGMMRSAARLTYTQVQNALDGMPDDTTGVLLDPVLRPLYAAFQALHKARAHRGSLDLDLPERKILIDEAGIVTGVVPRARYDSHRLIEEMMIAANVCAAEELEKLNQPCMYRVHDEPALERLEALREFLQSMDLNLATGAVSPKHFNHILMKVKGTPQEHLVNTVVLRAQAQAVYSPDNRGHFGLGLRRYAHFTSPIRRYSDLLVHRALVTGLGLGDGHDGLPADQGAEFVAIGEHISMTERRAATAEREAVDRFTAAYLSSHIGAAFTGRVTGVTRFGLFVELDDSGASGLVPVSSLPDDRYLHDEANHQLIGKGGRLAFGLGDAVVVRLREADPVTGGLILELQEATPASGGKTWQNGTPTAIKSSTPRPMKGSRPGRTKSASSSSKRTRRK